MLDPLTRNRTRTNTFEFVFSTDDRSPTSERRLAPEIFPVAYEEGIAHLMARRRHNIMGNDGNDVNKKGLLFEDSAYTKDHLNKE